MINDKVSRKFVVKNGQGLSSKNEFNFRIIKQVVSELKMSVQKIIPVQIIDTL